MRLPALFILLISCTLTLAQTQPIPALRQQPRSPQLHVIFILEPKGVEYGRLNMENDSLMSHFAETVQRGLNYPMQIRRLDEKHFTSQALRDTIAALKTTPNDIVILYYSGYGIQPAQTTEKFANWRLTDVKGSGLPISDVEGWLKAKNIRFALLVADCSTELVKNSGAVRLVYETVDLTKEIMKQLFVRNKGIVRLGSSAPSLPGYINTIGAGTTFTNALSSGFDYLLDHTDPATLPDVSFDYLRDLTTREIESVLERGFEQAAILELKNWDGTPVVQKPSVVGATPAGVRWQGFIADERAYDELRKKQRNQAVQQLPARIDLSMYAPPVLNQGDKGNCVAISIGYYMCSIMGAVRWNLNDKDRILKQSLSPFYLYSAVKSPNDNNCTYGIDPGQALEYLKQSGLPHFSAFPNPDFCTNTDERMYSSRIQDYVKLFNITDQKADKVVAVKQTLAERSPVVVGIQTTSSLQELSFTRTLLPRVQASVWQLIESYSGATGTADKSRSKLDMSWKPYRANTLAFGHAICVVGYDDNKLGKGKGAFKLVNSWGSSWGEGGYFWMSYETFGKFAKYGYQAYLDKNDSSVRLDTDLTIAIGVSRSQPSLRLIPSDTGLVTYMLSKPLPTGTKFKFRVDTKTKTYIHVITANESNGTVVLQAVGSNKPTLIAPASQIYFPSEQKYLTLEGRPGLEYMLFLFSDYYKGEEINQYVQAMNDLKGSFPERVKQVFGEMLISNRRIQYKPKKMGFFLARTNQVSGMYVPLLVSLKHVR